MGQRNESVRKAAAEKKIAGLGFDEDNPALGEHLTLLIFHKELGMRQSNQTLKNSEEAETTLRKSIKNRPVQASENGLSGQKSGLINESCQETRHNNIVNRKKIQAQNRSLADITCEIKKRINVKEYAEKNGFSFRLIGDSFRSHSIAGGDNKTCLAIRKDNLDYFTDFKSGDSGDVLTFCAVLKHDGEFYPALQELAELTDVDLKSDANGNIYSKRADLPGKVQYWKKSLLESPDRLGYLKKRLGGKAVETVKRLKLGYSEKRNRIMIPYLKGGHPVYFAGRYCGRVDKEHPKYYKAPKKDYGEQPCWGEDTLRREGPLILAEGAFDAISFEQEGYSVLSLFGGNPSQHQRQIVRSAARAKAEQGEETILIFDTDAAGISFTKQMGTDLFERGIPFKTATVPEGFKDVSEYYETHHKVDGILATAIDGLAYMVTSNVTSKTQFERFARRVSRNLSKPDIAVMFNTVKEMDSFDKVWLKELERACKADPPENLIAEEILEEHDLIYLNGIGFFEYENGVWVEKDEQDIKSYAMECCGIHAKKKLNDACHGLLQTKCKTHVELNRKWLIQFENGTLDLETGVLRSPNREDFLTDKSPYNYDPDAKCPLFEKTVYELMGGNEEKIRFLKQTIGYVVIAPENFMHKCLYWIGKGGNGKGVLIRVIEDVLGNANVSHVGISQLIKEWGRMRIEHSRVNVSAEEMENLRGTESYFKTATGGDVMDGNWKNENAIEFRPRANWLVAANHLPNMKDTSDGILRRLLFVRFTEQYIDNGEPAGSHQHKVDPHLNDKLKAELPGIFNWIYEGYKEFLANGEEFSYSKEHNEIMHELKMKLDPVALFVESRFLETIEGRDEFDFAEAYDAYRDWCEDFGYKTPLNGHNFSTRFKERFLEEPTEWHERRSHKKKRGYERKPDCRVNAKGPKA